MTIKRLVLVALDNLGDLVFTSALTPAIHARYPDARIDVWCKAYSADAAPLIPHVDRVIAADPPYLRSPNGQKGAWRPFLQAIARVRANRYDAAVVTGAPWRTAAAVAATGIPIRIGAARRRNRWFLTHVLPAADRTRPAVEQLSRLLVPLDCTLPRTRYALDDARLSPIRSAVRPDLPDAFVALHPFAGDVVRCVSLPVWSQLAFALQEVGLSVLWVGSTPELDELRARYTHPRGYYVDWIGDGSLAASIAALSLATAFVGHDSGPMHLAGACGVPVVGVFAPGEPARTFPQGTGLSRMIVASRPSEIESADIMEELAPFVGSPSRLLQSLTH